MTPLLSRDNDMTAWSKYKDKGSSTSGARGRPGDAKATSTVTRYFGLKEDNFDTLRKERCRRFWWCYLSSASYLYKTVRYELGLT
ncbi:hypothetical protein AWC38_SpisGene7671 [Stylophora pistillata]|uniref:Uncharacterized protein n=1 Tax=Stylophora pistillata TaxID=50429 RepID=A0A2B4SGC0_STYPI|nr:hypothetical protein AWC38_SpisGene7671 [Stylophora pistillata]